MGPLTGLKVIELQGIGPGPFCAMMLADMGAQVIRIDRAASVGRPAGPDVLARGRHSIAVDLKHADGVETVLKLAEDADVLVEGFRPGVMERLGLGPDVCLDRNPRLIFGRMTGWGQYGAIAHAAGHDINYISLTGALHAIGEAGGKPVPPLNLVGDFGGGGMLLAFGIVAALFERSISGKGQVVDAAMTDGSALLMNGLYPGMQSGHWQNARGTNMLDGGAHFYGSYETADGKYVSIGAIEPQFYALLLEKLELTNDTSMPKQMSRNAWPQLQQKFAAIFRTKTRVQWDSIMLGTDICYAPILDFADAVKHPHNVDRQTFVQVNGLTQAAPAPRFSRTSTQVPAGAPAPGQHTEAVLLASGFSAERIAALKASGAVA